MSERKKNDIVAIARALGYKDGVEIGRISGYREAIEAAARVAEASRDRHDEIYVQVDADAALTDTARAAIKETSAAQSMTAVRIAQAIRALGEKPDGTPNT